MGQYQQWLQYREIDRLLHTQLEELTEELAQLRKREQLLQLLLHPPHVEQQPDEGNTSSSLLSDNEILQALTTGFNGHTYNTNHTNHNNHLSATGNTTAIAASGTSEMTLTQSPQQDEPTSAISQALYAQGSLPPAEEQFVHNPVAAPAFQAVQSQFNGNSALPPVPHTPHSESMMLPEDMGAFIDEHTRTEPRMELPWWLRNAALLNANGPIDQESIRTNRLIQRWIERWGRHPDIQTSPDEHGVHTARKENGEDSSS